MPYCPVEVDNDYCGEWVFGRRVQEEDGGGVEGDVCVEVVTDVVEGAVGNVAVEEVV